MGRIRGHAGVGEDLSSSISPAGLPHQLFHPLAAGPASNGSHPNKCTVVVSCRRRCLQMHETSTHPNNHAFASRPRILHIQSPAANETKQGQANPERKNRAEESKAKQRVPRSSQGKVSKTMNKMLCKDESWKAMLGFFALGNQLEAV